MRGLQDLKDSEIAEIMNSEDGSVISNCYIDFRADLKNSGGMAVTFIAYYAGYRAAYERYMLKQRGNDERKP